MTTWLPGSAFTVGAEDELLLVDESDQLLGQAASSLVARLRSTSTGAGAVKGEIYVDQLELETPVCVGAEELMGCLARLRRSVIGAGARPMAVGAHPAAEFGATHMTSGGRYDRTTAEFAGLFRTPTASFQVHVGLPDTETALLAYRGLRNRLSLFRALAATSPYWHGRDSGLASARAALVRSYPRTTMPPALRSWDEYVERTERVIAVEEVPDYTHVWWELRPQPLLGTIEVRVMDAQASLDRAAGLAALVQGVARHAVEQPDEDDLPEEAVSANDFRACRYGLDASILEVNGSRRAMRDVVADAVDAARNVLAPDGLAGPLDVVKAMLVETPEPDRQRDLVAERGMPALLDDLVSRTADLGD